MSLNRHGPAAKPGPGQVRRAGVVLADGAQHVRVVDAGLVRDHQELVRDRELHVAPRVREELGQLGLLGRRPDGLRGEPAEEGRGARRGGVVVRADDLRQRAGAPRGRGPRRCAPGRTRRRPGSRARRGAGPRTRSCRGRPCCAARRARHRAGAGAIWSTAFSKIVIDGPRNSSTGVPMTTTSCSVRSIIEPSEPKLAAARWRGPRAAARPRRSP